VATKCWNIRDTVRGRNQVAALVLLIVAATVPERDALAQDVNQRGQAFAVETQDRMAGYKYTADQLIEGFSTRKLSWCDDQGRLHLLGTRWQYKQPSTIDDMNWIMNNANADVGSIYEQMIRRKESAGSYFDANCQSIDPFGVNHACERGAVNQYVQAALVAEMSELKLQRTRVIVAAYKYSMCFSFDTPAADQMQREIQRTLS
jgi:hypothetical protein